MRTRGGVVELLGMLLAILAIAELARAQTASPQAPPPAPSSASADQPIELDHVVANIGSNALLQSDVEQEMHLSALEPLQVLPGQNTPDFALRRLIDRTLILDQMEQQQQETSTPKAEIDESLAELRKQIPACAEFHCTTAEGWDRFLRSNDLTRDVVEERWSQRMAMLRFIDLRFRSGIRISQEQIATYYQKTLTPALAKDDEKAPPLADVSGRIQEILLQQQVSGLFQDWLGSLRDQGNVQVVDRAYSADLGAKPVLNQ
jgi:peptidyl-prolyl cis-trans isomerase SurA